MTTQPPQELPELPVPEVLRHPEDGEFTHHSDPMDTPVFWAWGAHGYDTGMEPFFSADQMLKFRAEGIAASQAGRAAEKGWTQERGYHALVQVIYELQNDGSYSDDEGEETLALTDLVLRMEEADATPPLEVRESAKCGYCGGSGSVNSWTTATSSDICFKCNGAGTATAKGE